MAKKTTPQNKSSKIEQLEALSRENNYKPKEIDPLIETIILKLVKITFIICLIIILLVIGGKIIMNYNIN